MRVLLTADAVGGVWTYATDLSSALAERGVDVTLAVMGPEPSAEQREHVQCTPRVTLEHRPYRLEWMDEPWADVDAAGEWLLRLEREHAADVVHLNGYAHAALPWRAPALVVAHSCVTTWWEAVHGTLPPPRYDRYRATVERGLHAADAVVAPTRAFLSAIKRQYGGASDARVIPNGRDADGLAPAPVKEDFALATGRFWDPAKNLAALDEAARGLPWPVVVAGDAHEPGKPAGKGPRHVTFAGRLPAGELRERYSRAAAFAHPARYEPFGLAPLEAAHAGCALVLADVPTLREVWGDAATFVDPDDPMALREALVRVLADRDHQRERGAAARERARSFPLSATADAYLDLYAELTGSARLPSMPNPEEEDSTTCAS